MPGNIIIGQLIKFVVLRFRSDVFKKNITKVSTELILLFYGIVGEMRKQKKTTFPILAFLKLS